MRIVVLCPHFDPDTAPTGHVISRIVVELASRGHDVHVATALPWYRDHALAPGWTGRLVRVQRTDWGSVTRVTPFPGGDRRNLPRRALGYVGFSLLVGIAGLRAGGWFRRADAVIAMSPPLTLGLTGWAAKLAHRAPLVFNIQDVFPDAAVETGAITDRRVIAVARWLERVSYRRADAVTVLSTDMADNVSAKIAPRHRPKVRVIPNFVDTAALHPSDRVTPYRRQLAIGDEPVVMYAGNVGFSQSLEMVIAAARAIPGATFVINGQGAARPQLEAAAAGLANIRFGDHQPADRLNEVLATGDIHLVPLRRGLGRVSVPSKTYSILAAGRPVVAAIDVDSEVNRIVTTTGCGVVVAPDDTQAFIEAIRAVLGTSDIGAEMGRAGRAWVESSASPASTAAAYEALFAELAT
ncbi:MAG TPA: glycosyltransferase family 4 protein [Ilumatobacteraceae bacterium]|nr:glycosyltransferase family 4 protein [Ilumatobacteraceae bacterium]